MARLADWTRALRTVRHLKPRQAALQLRRRVSGPARYPRESLAGGVEDTVLATQMAPPSREGGVDARGHVSLVGRRPYDPLGESWRATRDPLWTYTLHYHGWLSALTPDDAEATMLSWIAEHKNGVGWEPYPTSVRLLHWLGWMHRSGGARQAGPRDRILQSMAAQLQHLSAHLEEHIDGNHLWTNLAALTACGLGLRGPLPRMLVDRFAPRFIETVSTQLFGDGVHRERTPSYHCLLAEQLEIVTTLARRTRPEIAERLGPALRAMIEATAAFTHPDGDVALFGDSQLAAAVTPMSLSARTGIALPTGHALAPEGGFARRVWGPWTVLWTLGSVGLPWQTGHIHGDALAVEVSLAGERVIVDAGVGNYVPSTDRSYARSTRAHNTATVGYGEPDQHELWASHRVGRRAIPELIRAEPDLLRGRVRGVGSPGAHERTIRRVDDGIEVTDRVEPFAPASVRWFVPGDATVTIDGGTASITTSGGQHFRIVTNSNQLTCQRADGWLGMSRPAPRWCLASTIGPDGLVTRLESGA